MTPVLGLHRCETAPGGAGIGAQRHRLCRNPRRRRPEPGRPSAPAARHLPQIAAAGGACAGEFRHQRRRSDHVDHGRQRRPRRQRAVAASERLWRLLDLPADHPGRGRIELRPVHARSAVRFGRLLVQGRLPERLRLPAGANGPRPAALAATARLPLERLRELPAADAGPHRRPGARLARAQCGGSGCRARRDCSPMSAIY